MVVSFEWTLNKFGKISKYKKYTGKSILFMKLKVFFVLVRRVTCDTMRLFSSRYFCTTAPWTIPFSLYFTCMNFPNRLELLLWAVLALPNASRTGPALRMVCSTPEPWEPFCDSAVKWCNRKLVLSVLPEPDSPLITTHC